MAGTERGKLTSAVEYDIKHRPVAKKIIEECARRGVPIPAPFDDPPSVWPWLDIFMAAWNTLNEERSIGGEFTQVIRITREQVRQWLVWYGYDKDREFAEDCIFYVNRIEAVFIPLERKRRAEVAAKEKAAAKREAARNNKRR